MAVKDFIFFRDGILFKFKLSILSRRLKLNFYENKKFINSDNDDDSN